ncbi:MAG TPA: gamma-glutamyl-phosphate reductase, partial [Legionella sp.]|nr:gamma-glutamyl-phosphate reductase [Legionella sp.]
MHDSIINQLENVKESASKLAFLPIERRNRVLSKLADSLRNNKEELRLNNQKDLDRMDAVDPKYDRLLLTDERIDQIANDLELIASLSDPLNRHLSETIRPNGLII